MTISQLRENFHKTLTGLYPEREIDSFFFLLSEEYLGKKRVNIALDPSAGIAAKDIEKFQTALGKLEKYEPVQYIIGHTEFFGYKFNVDRNVLIPRPETEELIAWILADLPKDAKLKILDIGTGSGCIPISLKQNLPNANISAFDISEGALKVAKDNARLQKVSVEFKKVDILKIEKLPAKFDVIVSNPPYVRELEKKEMHQNVLIHEPETALYVANDNALVFYEKISRLASENLLPGGLLYFEINQYLAKETKDLVEKMNFEAQLKKDIFGNYRMIKAVKL